MTDDLRDLIKRNLGSAFQSQNDALRALSESTAPGNADAIAKLCEIATMATLCAEKLLDGDISRPKPTLTAISEFVDELRTFR